MDLIFVEKAKDKEKFNFQFQIFNYQFANFDRVIKMSLHCLFFCDYSA